MEMNELAEEIFKQAISHQLDDIHLLPIGEEYVFYWNLNKLISKKQRVE